MTKTTFKTYDLYFYDNYVIVEAHENAVIDGKTSQALIKLLLNHYKGKLFTLISHRNRNYTIKNDAYSPRIMEKLTALAVVSADEAVKQKALDEQLLFNKSFAFFDNIEDAIDWAESVSGGR